MCPVRRTCGSPCLGWFTVKLGGPDGDPILRERSPYRPRVWRSRDAREAPVERSQPVQRLVLELAAALFADVQPGGDLVVGLGGLAAQPVAAQQDLAMAL